MARSPGGRAVTTPEYERRLTAYESGMAELQEQLKVMEEEVVTLRRRLQDAPKRVRTLEERLLDTKGQLAQAVSQNEKLTYTLREAREHIARDSARVAAGRAGSDEVDPRNRFHPLGGTRRDRDRSRCEHSLLSPTRSREGGG